MLRFPVIYFLLLLTFFLGPTESLADPDNTENNLDSLAGPAEVPSEAPYATAGMYSLPIVYLLPY